MNFVKIRERKRANGRVYLFLDINYNRERKQESTGLFYIPNQGNKKEVKLQAEELRKIRERELDSGYLGKIKANIDFVKYFEDFNINRKHNGTNNSYVCALKQLKKFIKGKKYNTTFEGLEHNQRFFQDLVDYLQEHLATNSAWTYFAKIKAVLNNAVRERIIIQSPAKAIYIKWEEVEKVYLTTQELKILSEIECRYEIIKKAFLFSCYSGLRLSDIKKLKWKDVKGDPTGNTALHFRQKKTGGVEYFPLNKTAIDLINSTITGSNVIAHPESLIFELPYISKIGRALKSWVKKAKIDKHVTFHCGRHTFAVNCLASGVDIFTVSKLLGHRDLKTTLVYAKVIDSKLNEAVNKLPAISI